jgi:uncharacterized protein (TIGR02466 family)
MSVEFRFAGVEELFPSPLWVYNITDESICNNLTQIALELRDQESGQVWADNWWSEDDLQNRTSMKSFCDEILNKTEFIFNDLGLIRDSHYISNMWFTVSKPSNRQHNRHVHPNCLLSGVFYVKAPTGCASTNFYNPNPAQEMIRPLYDVPHRYTAKEVSIECKQGRMVIFPSWLPHSVEDGFDQKDPDEERIVLAFNIMMRGEINIRTAHLKLS